MTQPVTGSSMNSGMKNNGRLFLIPNRLGGNAIEDVTPAGTAERIAAIRFFAVENLKPARQFLAALGLREIIDQSEFITLHKGMDDDAKRLLENAFISGKDVGLISDAGSPGIADPGSEVVRIAHNHRVQVIPLTGPSSIQLALMASGFNGQNFVFHGYLPRERVLRKKKIREIDRDMWENDRTQIFIETPYRNDHVLEDLLSECQKKTVICLAGNLTMPDEKIEVKPVHIWSKSKPNLNKKQCIFLLYK